MTAERSTKSNDGDLTSNSYWKKQNTQINHLASMKKRWWSWAVKWQLTSAVWI